MNQFLDEWNDAVACACEVELDSSAGRWMRRVEAAGTRLAIDYVKTIERADREARLAVALRQKLEEVAGAEIASSVEAR